MFLCSFYFYLILTLFILNTTLSLQMICVNKLGHKMQSVTVIWLISGIFKEKKYKWFIKLVIVKNNALFTYDFLKNKWKEISKQDSLPTISFCDWIIKGLVLYMRVSFFKGLPKSSSNPTNQSGVYTVKAATATSNFNTLSSKSYRWCFTTILY